MFIINIRDIFCIGTMCEGNNRKQLEKLMKTATKKIERFKIYSYKSFLAVEDVRGFFRVIEKNGHNNWKIREFESKPKVLQEYQLLSRAEMEWDAFFQGYSIKYIPTRRISDARTPEERIEIWEEQRVYREGLEGLGYLLTDLKPGAWYDLEIPLKIFDLITSEEFQRIEFEARNKLIKTYENVNVVNKSA